jgi:hypothetical protein
MHEIVLASEILIQCGPHSVSWDFLSAVEYELGNLPSVTEIPYKYLPLVDIAHLAPFHLYVRRCIQLRLDNLKKVAQIHL